MKKKPEFLLWAGERDESGDFINDKSICSTISPSMKFFT